MCTDVPRMGEVLGFEQVRYEAGLFLGDSCVFDAAVRWGASPSLVIISVSCLLPVDRSIVLCTDLLIIAVRMSDVFLRFFLRSVT